MSFFNQRPRHFKVLNGLLDNVVWPTQASLVITLSPTDAFGPSNQVTRRSTLVKDSSGPEPNWVWDANTGRGWAECDIFLQSIYLNRCMADGTELKFQGNVLTWRGEFSSERALREFLNVIEFQLTAYMSLYLGVFVRTETITGTIVPQVNFRYELIDNEFHFQVSDEKTNLQYIQEAVDLLYGDKGVERLSTLRFIYACLYYQEALRLNANYETDIPQLNFAEMFLNLAKCIELLFTSNRDILRSKCRLLGYSDAQIEGQIVPVLVMRNELDIGHPFARPVSIEQVRIIRKYGYRSLINIRTLLVTIGKSLLDGEYILDPLPEQTVADTSRLCKKLSSYLEEPLLPLI